MSFSKIIEESFVLIAKEFSKLEYSKLSRSLEDRKDNPVKTPKEYKPGICFELHGAKDVNINHIDGGNCILITIKESSGKKTSIAYQMAITHSGNVFIRISQAKSKGSSTTLWGKWRRIITDDEPILDRIALSSESMLEIKGDVLIEDLRKKKLGTQKLEDLSAVVSDEKGHLFSLPYGRSEDKNHLIIPILRSGRLNLGKDSKKTILDLFDPSDGKFRSGYKHLIEIKLLFNYIKGQGAAIIYYINKKLHIVHGLGIVNANNVEQKSDEWLNFKDHQFTMKILTSKKNKNECDIEMGYSGKETINIRYFITRYSTN